MSIIFPEEARSVVSQVPPCKLSQYQEPDIALCSILREYQECPPFDYEATFHDPDPDKPEYLQLQVGIQPVPPVDRIVPESLRPLLDSAAKERFYDELKPLLSCAEDSVLQSVKSESPENWPRQILGKLTQVPEIHPTPLPVFIEQALREKACGDSMFTTDAPPSIRHLSPPSPGQSPFHQGVRFELDERPRSHVKASTSQGPEWNRRKRKMCSPPFTPINQDTAKFLRVEDETCAGIGVEMEKPSNLHCGDIEELSNPACAKKEKPSIVDRAKKEEASNVDRAKIEEPSIIDRAKEEESSTITCAKKEEPSTLSCAKKEPSTLSCAKKEEEPSAKEESDWMDISMTSFSSEYSDMIIPLEDSTESDSPASPVLQPLSPQDTKVQYSNISSTTSCFDAPSSSQSAPVPSLEPFIHVDINSNCVASSKPNPKSLNPPLPPPPPPPPRLTKLTKQQLPKLRRFPCSPRGIQREHAHASIKPEAPTPRFSRKAEEEEEEEENMYGKRDLPSNRFNVPFGRLSEKEQVSEPATSVAQCEPPPPPPPPLNAAKVAMRDAKKLHKPPKVDGRVTAAAAPTNRKSSPPPPPPYPPPVNVVHPMKKVFQKKDPGMNKEPAKTKEKVDSYASSHTRILYNHDSREYRETTKTNQKKIDTYTASSSKVLRKHDPEEYSEPTKTNKEVESYTASYALTPLDLVWTPSIFREIVLALPAPSPTKPKSHGHRRRPSRRGWRVERLDLTGGGKLC